MSEKARTQRELSVYSPDFCPNCSVPFEGKDVKELEPENNEHVRWSTFCGYCGAIYTIEIAP